MTQFEGTALLSAPEAILKGVLESEMETAILAGPRRSGFRSIFDVATDAQVAAALRQHNTRVVAVPDAGRAVTLAVQVARAGKAGFALVPNEQLDQTIDNLVRAQAELAGRSGAVGVLLEDSPREYPASCPRLACRRLNMPCLEASDVSHLRDLMDRALRLSRAGHAPVGVVAHRLVLRSADTLQCWPNRVSGSVDAQLAQRKRQRTARWTEAGGLMRMARRLELNRFRAVPSPGERVPVGFLTVGPADASLLHLAHELQLFGRVPMLHLGLVHPVDEVAVERMLERCHKVILLEPRPGTMEPAVLAVAEMMRHRGAQPATVWTREIPPDESGQTHVIATDDDLHPSILARKTTHLLHSIRPSSEISSRLAPDPPALPSGVNIESREAKVGATAALAVVRRIVTDVDQWLRDRAPLEERGVAPTALAIDGAAARGVSSRVVLVETWEHRQFQNDGVAALIQAARDDRPWIIIACESESEEVRDLERLARGAVPAERADRVSIEIANLSDLVVLRDRVREASLVDKLSIIIVHDGPPARYDVTAIEDSLIEIDRLGFEPRQHLVRSVEELCALHQTIDDQSQELQLEHSSLQVKSSFSVDPVSARVGATLRLRVRPLLEEVEVVRTRPPAASWKADTWLKLTPPLPLHGKSGQWRAHLAGFRREPPGVAAEVLCQAGRHMGYHVRCVHDPSPIGAGRRAWAQVLFTKPRDHEPTSTMTASIPYGEADLLLGLDGQESLRAISPDHFLRVAQPERTHLVANVGSFNDESEADVDHPDEAQLRAALAAVNHPEHKLIEDFASACRLWFHTDRVVDVAMLGAAYQLGFVPVSAEAMEAAVSVAENKGAGRCREVFEFGRRLSLDPSLFNQPVDEREEDVARLARRMTLSLSRSEWGGGRKAREFADMMGRSLDGMPGLAETESGREARRNFVIAAHRCITWGGLEYARLFVNLINGLYQVDRGDTGRSLTRHAVLPLAEAMLIRDPLFIACMATSSEQRRRLRQRLNVKVARGDRMEQRYLTRFEVVARTRRWRGDVRTSDWPAQLVAWSRRIVPTRWRGLKRERDLREFVIELLKSSIEGSTANYESWNEAMMRLHTQAADNRLRGMAISELRMLIAAGHPIEALSFGTVQLEPGNSQPSVG